MAYRDIDIKPNLINYTDFYSKGINGLTFEFIQNAIDTWDKTQPITLGAALRKIGKFSYNIEATDVDANRLSFRCKDRNGMELRIILYKVSEKNDLPLICFCGPFYSKIYEVAYSDKIKKLYLNLTDAYFQYGKESSFAKIHRKISNDAIGINLRKSDIRVEIKITRSRSRSTFKHFMIEDEECFLQGLSTLEKPITIYSVFNYFLEKSKLDLMNNYFEINIYKIKKSAETGEEKESVIGELLLESGGLSFYKSGDGKEEPFEVSKDVIRLIHEANKNKFSNDVA